MWWSAGLGLHLSCVPMNNFRKSHLLLSLAPPYCDCSMTRLALHITHHTCCNNSPPPLHVVADVRPALSTSFCDIPNPLYIILHT